MSLPLQYRGRGITVIRYKATPKLSSALRHQAAERVWKPEPCYVEFNDLKYSVQVPAKDQPTCGPRQMEYKVLLDDVFGYAPPGKLVRRNLYIHSFPFFLPPISVHVPADIKHTNVHRLP